jgi:hypothetical protein
MSSFRPPDCGGRETVVNDTRKRIGFRLSVGASDGGSLGSRRLGESNSGYLPVSKWIDI